MTSSREQSSWNPSIGRLIANFLVHRDGDLCPAKTSLMTHTLARFRLIMLVANEGSLSPYYNQHFPSHRRLVPHLQERLPQFALCHRLLN